MQPREWLLHCIKELAARSSNPVREVLQGITTVEMERAYPDPELTFAGCGVHAFYHCHDAPGRPGDEHGHFHIYLLTGDRHPPAENRVHLAGLSMDRSGQPLRWFSLNRWVTGGAWLTPDEILDLIPRPKTTKDLVLTESWLLAMLAVYRRELRKLLEERDRMLTQLAGGTDPRRLLDHQGFYEFSTMPIDLLVKFKQA